MSDTRLLTPEELGERYQVTGKQIRIWTAQGTISAAVREGRILRYDAEVVAKELAKRAKQSRPPTPPPAMVPVY